MTSQEYQQLSIDEKADILWEQGTFLNEVIEYGKFRVNIYELNKFFVGAFYSVVDNKIIKIEVLATDLKDQLLKNLHLN